MLSDGFGGAERAFVDLCSALARRGGVEVRVICRAGSEAESRLAHIPDLSISPIRVLGNWDLMAARSIRQAIINSAANIVHVRMSRAAHLGGRAASKLAVPVVTQLHNYVNLKYYRHVDWFGVSTERQRSYLLQKKCPANRIRVIPEFSSFPPSDTVVLNGEAPPKVWVAFGRFVHKKGFDHLLRAFAKVLKYSPQSTLILGGDGYEAERLKSETIALGIEDSVEFPGWVTDVSGLLKSADVFVLPSRDEPFGIAILEAMACGVPIVSTLTHGPSEILDESTAYLCAVDDDEDLFRAMRAVIENPAKARIKASAALELYRGCYHEDVVMPELMRLYKDALLEFSKKMRI